MACMLCGHCPGDELHPVLYRAALQGLRDDLLAFKAFKDLKI